MKSTQRNISCPLRVDSAKPPKPIYRRSTSLPIPDDYDSGPKTNSDALLITKNGCRCINDERMKAVPVGNRIQHKQASCSSIATEFLGFGATPPRANARTKKCFNPLLVRERSQGSLILLQDAERLVQNILQDDTIKISQETVNKAIQRNAGLQSKKRYSSLLEKPWRINSKTLLENTEFNGCDVCAKSNKEGIRRSLSSDSVAPPSSSEELTHSKKALEQANERILSLQKDLEKFRDRKKSIDNPLSDEYDSLSSTNNDDDDDDDEIVATVSFVSDNTYDAIQPPLEFIQAPSPKHRLSKKRTGSDNVVSRLEYRALQIRNEQLLQKLSYLEKELSPDAIDGPSDDVSGSSSPEFSSHESEKEAISGILCKLTNVDKSQQLKYMEAKIAALIKQLHQSESKCRLLTDNEVVAKATIENLSSQLLECEQKAKEYSERLMVQTETRLKKSHQDLMRMEQELSAAKEDVSLMRSARLAAESKCLQLEQIQVKVVSSLQSQLNHAESKSHRLQVEVNNLMATTVEMEQVKAECELLQNKLRQSENRVLVLQSNEDSIKQAAVKDVQDRADVLIAQLEVSLSEANAMNEIVTQRLANLELAQAKEQEILSEELRESETTIACLMEEIASLKPLSMNIVALQKLLQEKEADYELKEKELAAATAALTLSEADVVELRNELGMLTSLPEIVRKMEKELKVAHSKLEKIGENSFGVSDIAAEQDQSIADRYQLLELREAYYMAEDEVAELESQLDLLRPLASDLENAEKELRETCVKLDKAELEVETLTNELDMMQTALTDLNEAEQELSETRTSLTLREQELQQCRAEILALHKQLNCKSSPLTEQQVNEAGIEHCTSLNFSHTTEDLEAKVFALEQFLLAETERKAVTDISIADLVLQLSEAHGRSSLLLAEIDVLNKKCHVDSAGSACSSQSSDVENANSLVHQLQEHSHHKVETMREVNSTFSEQENLSKGEFFEKKQESASFVELTSLVAKQLNCIAAEERKMAQLAIEFSSLIADRDSLKENLATMKSKVFELKMEIKRKDSMVQDLMLRQNDGALLEVLRDEKDRTLERCSDLSLQLAESQFKIDRLTEQLRDMQKNEMVAQQQTTTSRHGALFQSLISSSIDRISSRLDDSLPSSNRGSAVDVLKTQNSPVPFSSFGGNFKFKSNNEQNINRLQKTMGF
jgi:hypothetical protein